MDDPEGLLDRPGERLLDEHGDAALDRGEGQRQVGVGRGRDDDAVEVRLGDHRERVGEALGAGAGDRGGEDVARPDRRRRPAGVPGRFERIRR